jgi:hypothetical protein
MPITSKFTALAAATAIGVTSILPITAFADNVRDTASSPPSVTEGLAVESDSIVSGEVDQITTGSIAEPTKIIIKRISALENDEALQFDNISQDQLAAAQEKLQANPSLASELQAEGVQLNNVVSVETFNDGGALVYVR